MSKASASTPSTAPPAIPRANENAFLRASAAPRETVLTFPRVQPCLPLSCDTCVARREPRLQRRAGRHFPRVDVIGVPAVRIEVPRRGFDIDDVRTLDRRPIRDREKSERGLVIAEVDEAAVEDAVRRGMAEQRMQRRRRSSIGMTRAGGRSGTGARSAGVFGSLLSATRSRLSSSASTPSRAVSTSSCRDRPVTCESRPAAAIASGVSQTGCRCSGGLRFTGPGPAVARSTSCASDRSGPGRGALRARSTYFR